MSKHTPWYVDRENAVGTPHIRDEDDCWLGEAVDIDTARLFAAAPELLAACRHLVAAVEPLGGTGDPEVNHAFRLAHAALAKATGETPEPTAETPQEPGLTGESLARAAACFSDHPGFCGYRLSRYRAHEGMDVAELASRLGCSFDDLNSVSLASSQYGRDERGPDGGGASCLSVGPRERRL